MEEKITLSKEQAERFIQKFLKGDIYGFEELQNILEKELKIEDKILEYTIFDLLRDTVAMNNMLVLGCEQTSELSNLYTEIYTLYDKLKTKLFDSFTNDFNILFKRYQ